MLYESESGDITIACVGDAMLTTWPKSADATLMMQLGADGVFVGVRHLQVGRPGGPGRHHRRGGHSLPRPHPGSPGVYGPGRAHERSGRPLTNTTRIPCSAGLVHTVQDLSFPLFIPCAVQPQTHCTGCGETPQSEPEWSGRPLGDLVENLRSRSMVAGRLDNPHKRA